jgi:hypothetical protein
MSLLLASFGIGVLAHGEMSIWPGFFTLPAIALAFLGAVYPKRVFFRVALLAPVLALSVLGSMLVLMAHEDSHEATQHIDVHHTDGF